MGFHAEPGAQKFSAGFFGPESGWRQAQGLFFVGNCRLATADGIWRFIFVKWR
jgi:hypothetical protein